VTMALVIPSGTGGPYRGGPGSVLYGSISGPTAVDDFVIAFFQDHATSNLLAQGQSPPLGGSTAWELTMTAPGGFYGLVDNAVVDLYVQAYHASFVMFDSVTYLSLYRWDPVSNLGNLLLAFGNADIAAILAAVKPTYHNV